MYKNIGNIIADHVEPLGFQVVKTYQGHGTGAMFH
jgi:methionine aminopeptidase